MVLTYGNLNVGWAAFSEKQLLFEATEGKKKAFILAFNRTMYGVNRKDFLISVILQLFLLLKVPAIFYFP